MNGSVERLSMDTHLTPIVGDQVQHAPTGKIGIIDQTRTTFGVKAYRVMWGEGQGAWAFAADLTILDAAPRPLLEARP